MHRIKSYISLILLEIIASPLLAAVSPPGYLEMTAVGKRQWHIDQLVSHPYTALPGSFSSTCAAALAFGVNFSPELLSRTMNEPSGYAEGADDFFRGNFGKGIHSRGPMAPGEFVLKESIMGLNPGPYAVTYRFSLANPYFPGAQFRPGFLIIIHRDDLPDINLFMMPPNGLNGFFLPQNPFEIPLYTHWLDKPWLPIRAVARATFGRVVEDPYTQFIVSNEPPRNYLPTEEDRPTRSNSSQIYIAPRPYWARDYSQTRGDIRNRFEQLTTWNLEPVLFDANVVDSHGTRTLGEFRVLGPFLNGPHSDAWLARHQGWWLR